MAAIWCFVALFVAGTHALSTSQLASKFAVQPMRIRGGGTPILSTRGMFDTGSAAIGLQSVLMTAMPRETYKMYGVSDDRISERTEAFTELWGNSLLIKAALIFFSIRSDSLSKALSFASLIECGLAMRYALKRCDRIGQPKEHILAWALFAAVVACLGLSDGLGLVDGDIIVKLYAAFTGLHAIAGIIMPKTMASAYGIPGALADDVEAFTYRNACFPDLGSALFLWLFRTSPPLAFGAAWMVFVVQCLYNVFLEEWRHLELPNGLPPVVLALVNAGFVYNAVQLVRSSPAAGGRPGSSSVRDK